MSSYAPDTKEVRRVVYWRGLGFWNLYFIAKLVLYWAGALNFHALQNLMFAAALLVPIPWVWLHRVRMIAAIPVGIALLYYDTWFPPFRRLLAQPEVLAFSGDYLLELLGRFINWELVGAGFVLLVAYMYLSQYLRFTVFTVLGLSFLVLSPLIALPTSWVQPALQGMAPERAAIAHVDDPGQGQRATETARIRSGEPDSNELNSFLDAFYQDEQARKVAFPASPESEEPFDVLFLNICSLSWADLRTADLDQHPIWRRMDVIFDRFNSVTTYSGPAVIRLLRASCGQSSQPGLYEPNDSDCYLFENLEALGFDTQATLNHDGQFQGFLNSIVEQGGVSSTYVPTEHQPVLSGFDGSPIWNDLETLNAWLSQRMQSDDAGQAMLYNSITLHDGNREIQADGSGRFAPFESRARQLLDDLNVFLDRLEQSGRKVLVVIIPEHGAALEGDRMQIAGMREIPTPDITQIPVGVRLIGAKHARGETLHVTTPASYLALAELVSRLLSTDVFNESPVDWAALVEDLPATQAISENEGSVFMFYDDIPYVRMDGRDWIKYPQ